MPSDLLRRDPAGQAVPLPDGRWLVRSSQGVSLIPPRFAPLLPKLLPLLDPPRSLEEVQEALAPEPPEDVRGVLESLIGELVEVVEPAAPTPSPEPPVEAARQLPEETHGGPRIVLIVEGAGGERIAEGLARAGFPGAVRLPPAGLEGASLVVACLEEVSYRSLLEIQAACLSAGIPALFVTCDPDGVRVGPAAVPGISPCLACVQLAGFRFLGLPPEELLEAVAGFQAGRSPEVSPSFGAAASALVSAARDLLEEGAAPALLTEILLFPTAGGVRWLPVERHPGCPLCGGLRARDGDLERRAARIRVEAVDRQPARTLPPDPEGLVRTVGILGGGTAGYLAALALRRKLPHLAVSLIESSDVPIIGVGEATTPLMPQFLHVDLGLDPHRLFREVRPTLKLGIRFLWGAPETGDFHYPFGPVHALEPVVYGGDLKECSLQSLMMAAGTVPLYSNGAGWTNRLGTAAAYHLDNERFVAYLQSRAALAGVQRIEATVAGVEKSDDGEEVRALVTADGRRLSFDLYLDCSGFRSLLLEEGLASPWIGFEGSLWTDRAVVAPVPHGGNIQPYTTAETLSCGWCWNTPQEEVDHRGYVFASAFQTPEEAEAEMRRANPGMGPARLVRFRAGRHAHFWKGNVVALGNAYGFVEPLESTALHMLIRQIGLLVRSFPVRRGERGLQALLNRQVGSWWDYLRWFLAIHYRFNRRVDSPFWRACRSDVDVSSHAELLAAFQERGPLSYDPASQSAFDYPDPLWGPEGIDALLLGQGVPSRLPRPALDRATWDERRRLARETAAGAVRHGAALELLRERPELLESFMAEFRAAGPAFPVI
ncbi:MAG TPA: tryptophan 7-halogenase [Thermoanaerobaculia bacterium]|nr:tryptophan 7-halogenase [Thermoanaerobaculia bacterium]